LFVHIHLKVSPGFNGYRDIFFDFSILQEGVSHYNPLQQFRVGMAGYQEEK